MQLGFEIFFRGFGAASSFSGTITLIFSTKLSLCFGAASMGKKTILFHENGFPFQLISKASMAKFPYSSSASPTTPLSSHFRTSDYPQLTTIQGALDSFNTLLCLNPRPPAAKFDGMVREATAIVKAMMQKGQHPDIFTYNSLLDGFCRAGRMEDAETLLKEMCNHGQFPDMVTWGTLLSGWCRNGNIDKALALFQQMESSRLKPRISDYNILIGSLWKARRVNEARDMFARLSKDERLQPDVHTYTVVMDGLCKQGLVDEAYDLFRAIEKNSCVQNKGSYNVIIHGFLRHKDPLEAVELIQEMVNKGFSADATTLALLVELLPKNQPDHPLLRKLLGDSYVDRGKVEPQGLSAED